MSYNLIAGVVGTALVGAFLLYYVLAVRSTPLSIIMVAILLMVLRVLYDEAKKKNG